MRHYNKSVFSVKCIECDCEFESTMDEVWYGIGIEMNDVNTDDHAHEIESNNRVIKERFRIVYYRFPYK